MRGGAAKGQQRIDTAPCNFVPVPGLDQTETRDLMPAPPYHEMRQQKRAAFHVMMGFYYKEQADCICLLAIVFLFLSS
jgi:hypothetical protein